MVDINASRQNPKIFETYEHVLKRTRDSNFYNVTKYHSLAGIIYHHARAHW